MSGVTITNTEGLFDQLANLKHLTTLKMYNVKFDTSELPSEVGNLENLESLVITNSKLSKIPKDLANLKKLTTLDLSNNRIEGYIPYKLMEIEKLSTL